MTRTELKQLTELCTCGHPATDHKFTRIAGGCTHNGNCSCIAYRTSDATGLRQATPVELEHWVFHVGLPQNTPQMTAAECHRAYAEEQKRQAPTLAERELAAAEKYLANARGCLRLATQEVEEYTRKVAQAEARLAELAGVKEPAAARRLAA